MTHDVAPAAPPAATEPQHSGDGLVLRAADDHDVDAITELNTQVFGDSITGWTADLLSGTHPTVSPSDFTVVEDTATGRIVSSLCLISQTWQYDGIPFGVGRVDLVATDPAYRRRGLVRKQFDLVHARSAAKGHLLQVITGIDWFYRQFGYDMGVQLFASRYVDAVHLPAAGGATGDVDYRLRAATRDDHDFIRSVYDATGAREVFGASRSAAEWAYEFEGRTAPNTRRREWLVIEGRAGTRVGYVQYLPVLPSRTPMVRVYHVELIAGVSYLNARDGILAGLWRVAQDLVTSGAVPEAAGLELALERDHPMFRALTPGTSRPVKPSPWFIRVPDMVAFLRRISPALEQHLVGTLAEGYSGDLKLDFFRGGLRLVLKRGTLTGIERWDKTDHEYDDARFPDDAFLRLVCGWRRFGQLAESYADCWGSHEAAVVLDALFPPYNGKVWVLA